VQVTLFGALNLILLLGSLVYVLEFPENKAMFPNIPSAMWWCVNCLSTVGYGDVYPQSGQLRHSPVALPSQRDGRRRSVHL
jgi:hypothetical protein